MDYLVMFWLGAAVGSFLSVVIYRLRTGESALKGRSRCDHCKKQIAWFDNIPLLSYLLLGGKCRYCKKKIRIDNLILELLVGVQFVWIYWLLKVNFSFFGHMEGFYSFALLIYWLILFSGSLAIAVYDIKHMLIPDQVLLPLIGAAFLRLFFSNQWRVLIVALGSSLFLYSIAWLSKKLMKKEAMGFGDVKLAFLMGLVLGWPLIIVSYFIAFLTGAGVGVILILIGNKKLKSKIAFGPFLLLGMLISKLWGISILNWYLGLVL
ncbi:MAG: prepilin peptidase [Patescibacteria group bacterium]|nr:prepilin peptidase [Patescibacteria group bacterium]